MSNVSVIDVEPLLVPIEGENPSGRYLNYDPEYDALKDARRSEDDTHQGDWTREVKVASWDEVLSLGTECLVRKTKDLQIAAWMTEALAHLYGFAGLREGFRLLRELLERFWDSIYPEIEDGDLELRAGPFEFLNQDRLIPLILRETALTAGFRDQNYSFLRWQESRTTDNVGKKDPEQLAALLADGKITGEQFDEAVNQTPRSFYEALNSDFEGAWEAYRRLDATLDNRFGKDAPSLAGIRKAFEDIRKVLTPILNTKRAAEPDGEPEPEATETEPERSLEEWGSPESAEVTTPPRPTPRARGPVGPILDAEDAVARILEASTFLRRNDPANPVSFAVVRAIRMAELYALGNPPDPQGLASPASQTRQNLKRLAAEGDWDLLLEEAEQSLSRPEGRAWLDAHRHAISAMASSRSADRTAAVTLCRALLRTLLADYPSLVDAELADDTPTANAETRSWIEAEILPSARAEPESFSPPMPVDETPGRAGDHSDAAEPDPWDLALEDVQEGRHTEGLKRLRQAVRQATSGREKFRRKLQMAELCLTVGNQRVALPLLEELALQVDEFHLEQWEDESLCARVWGALYRALRDSGTDEHAEQASRLREVYTRLCRLDINQALSYDGR